jgi:hypothetical protein
MSTRLPDKSTFLLGFLQGLTAPALLFDRHAYAPLPLPASPLATNGLLGASFAEAYKTIVRERLL